MTRPSEHTSLNDPTMAHGENMGDRGRGPSSAIEGSGSIQMGFDGLEPKQLRSWHRNFAPYENLAGNEKIAKRALAFVLEHKRKYQEKTETLRNKWQLLNYLLDGNTLSEFGGPDSPHVPELYKMLETLVPRIEESIFQYDPWFSVRGKDQMDHLKASRIKAFLDYQLRNARVDSIIPYAIRCMLIYSFAAVKNYWSFETDFRVKREVSRNIGEGGLKIDIQRKEVEEIVFEGPKTQLLDPFRFIIDHRCVDQHDATMIGDESDMSYDRIAELGEQGVFLNWKDLADQPPVNTADYYESSRSIAYENTGDRSDNSPEGSARMYPLLEVWGRFDLYGTGRTRECAISVANENTVLRVQENPFDDKHRPYSIAKACKKPFEFHSTGPLDNGIPLSIEMDLTRQIGMETSKMAMCPVIVADSSFDIPDSMWGIEPGTVLKGDPSGLRPLDVKNSISAMATAEEILRRDFEEITGAPRIFEGTSSGDTTATSVERKVQEGNKRVRGYVRAFCELCESLLGQYHSLNQQYVTRDQKFRVLGKAGAGLNEYEEIGPQDFAPDVDFEFLGISNLHTVGMEATNMQQFLGAAWPLIQSQPGLINVPAALDYLFERLVGKQPGQKIVNVPDDISTMMTQVDECQIMASGEKVPIHPMDNDAEHMGYLEYVMGEPEFKELHPNVQMMFIEHYYNHEQALRQKAAREAAAMNVPHMVPGASQMGVPGQGSLPQQHNQDPGQTPPGETPGPTNAMRQSKPGRDYGFSQVDNMGTAQ